MSRPAGRDRPATRPTRPVRVLLEPGSYQSQNTGDLAMLQAAIIRLRAVFPGCVVQVMTADPARLLRHCPDVVPVPTTERAPWITEHYVARRLPHATPAAARRVIGAVERTLARRWPLGYAGVAGARLPRRPTVRPGRFLNVLRDTDLVVIAGQGSMGDASAEHARIVLATLRLAQERGLPTAMLGQGMGPLADAALAAGAAAVLPRVRVIALREPVGGPALLARLGVPADRVRVTGDDAIELAHDRRPAVMGDAIGVNLRVSGNAGTREALVPAVARVLAQFGDRQRVPPLQPVPIAHGRADDAGVIRALGTALGVDTDGGRLLDTPAASIAAAGRARVMLTGAYHAAVFALAQGVPAVCLTGSPYYDAKFAGLEALFGAGCRTLSVRQAPRDFAAALRAALDAAWRDAEALRPSLLSAASLQLAAGRRAAAAVGALLRAEG